MTKLSASVICAEPLNLFSDLKICLDSGIDQLHFDVMDGIFVPRYGLYPEILAEIKNNFNVPVDVHMMTKNPENYIDVFAKNKADYFIFHLESTSNPTYLIEKIKEKNMKPGIALNPATPSSSVKDLLGLVDYVLLMMINPGVLGSPVYDFVIDKIAEIKYLFVQKNVNYNLYNFINQNGGWDEWEMLLIEELEYDNNIQSLQRERFWIEIFDASLNTIKRPIRYEEEIREYTNKYNTMYRNENKEYYKNYRDTHKEKKKEYNKEYYLKNKELKNDIVTVYDINILCYTE
jgi:ribulose-phosphate 3-epimerase